MQIFSKLAEGVFEQTGTTVKFLNLKYIFINWVQFHKNLFFSIIQPKVYRIFPVYVEINGLNLAVTTNPIHTDQARFIGQVPEMMSNEKTKQ